MTFVPAANVLEVQMVGTLAAQPVQNSLHVLGPAVWTQASFDVLRANVTDLMNALKSGQSTDFSWIRVDAVDLTSQTAPTYSHVIPGGIAGTSASPSLPNNVAYCVSFRTAGRGRSSRGRNYIAGLSETHVTANNLSGTVISTFLAAYSAFSAACEADGFNWVVLSRFQNGQPRQAGLTQFVTAVVATDTVVDSQRRRLPGRGPAG